MLRPELGEKFPGRPSQSLLGLLQSLADSFPSIGSRSDIEQALISFGVLHHGLRLPFNGKHHRPLGLLELLHKIARPAAESREGLNVFGDVEHVP